MHKDKGEDSAPKIKTEPGTEPEAGPSGIQTPKEEGSGSVRSKTSSSPTGNSEEAAPGSADNPIKIKRGPGRPKGSKNIPKHLKVKLKSKKLQSQKGHKKRGPGRPPKNPAAVAAAKLKVKKSSKLAAAKSSNLGKAGRKSTKFLVRSSDNGSQPGPSGSKKRRISSKSSAVSDQNGNIHKHLNGTSSDTSASNSENERDRVIVEGSSGNAPPANDTRAFWRPPEESRPLLDRVFITDVTANDVSITIRESTTDAGFFKKRDAED